MSKNVAVFVDVANIFYAAKAAGVDIDYVTLLKSATAGRDLVRAYAYTGLDPENENQKNFHEFLKRSGYKVVSKDIRKYGDGRIKANLDIELVVTRLGERSATMRYTGYRHRDGQLCVICEITMACIDLGGFKSRAIPPDIRALFARFQVDAAPAAQPAGSVASARPGDHQSLEPQGGQSGRRS